MNVHIHIIVSYIGCLCVIPAIQGTNNEVTSQIALSFYTFASSCFASSCLIYPQLFWTKQLLDVTIDKYHILFSRLLGIFVIFSSVCLWFISLTSSFRLSAVFLALFALIGPAYIEFCKYSNLMFKYVHACMIVLTVVYFSTSKYF
jgi:hypothetical protein